jgi:cellobiose phosphorylase
MKYGHFDDDRKEYVITHLDTPIPWINYLGCESYFALISNKGAGYSFYKDPRYRRVIRFRYNNVPLDIGGRFLYLRNNDSNKVWSPTGQPIRKNLDEYKCRHGLGYTIIKSKYMNIVCTVKFFVPIKQNLEIWEVEIENKNEKSVNLSLFSCVEFCLWNALDDSTNFQRNLNIGEVEIEDNTIYHKTEYRERRNHFSYFSCSEDINGFDTQRKDFLGKYRRWDNPKVVEEGKSNCSIAHGWSPVGSHHVKVSIEPNGSKKIIFLLGYFENQPSKKFANQNSQVINKIEVKKVFERFHNEDIVNKAFMDLKEYYNSLIKKFKINTPNVHTNRMVNIWNQYQCITTFNLSRSASFFESGISRGIGFRDSNQDLLGIMHLIPKRARHRILDLAATQLETGGVYHQYQPLTKKGNSVIGDNFNDDPLWLIISTAAYIKETNDFSILEELVPYENEKGSEKPLLDHLERSISYTLNNLGPHGLPLIGRADWNDCLNLNCESIDPDISFQTAKNNEGKVAESIFIGALFIIVGKELVDIFSILNNNEKVHQYQQYVEEMTSRVEKYGWDGEWFLRAYDKRGNKIGSNFCDEGRIYIETQGLCVMAGIGMNEDLGYKALNSVNKYLNTKHGIMLLNPPYSYFRQELGEISSYPPGNKENGSIFCHTNPWIIISEAILRNKKRAFDYYLKINPSKREELSDIHTCEPYVYAQTIAGKDSPNFGEAKNSWLTGTAAWNWVAISQYILGINPTYEGLQIKPVIPEKLKKIDIVRVFRGVKYNISIQRKGKGNNVIIFVENKEIEGDIIPPKTNLGGEINVEVIIK